MIKNGLKNFAKNLKYIVVPLGIIFVFILFGLSSIINGATSAIKTMIDEVKELFDASSLDFISFLKCFGDEFLALDWNDFTGALKTIGSTQWLTETIRKAFEALVSNFNYEEIAQSIMRCVISIVISVVVALVLFVVGVITAYFVTRGVIYHSTAKTKVSRSILFGILETIGIFAIVTTLILFVILWGPFIFFALLIVVPAIQCWHLAIAYWKYAYKKVKFTKIFNIKNVALAILTNIIIVIFTCSVAWLFSLFINNFVMFFIGLSIFEVMLATNSANISSYTKKYVEGGLMEKEEAKKLEKAAKKAKKKDDKPKEETSQISEEVKEQPLEEKVEENKKTVAY